MMCGEGNEEGIEAVVVLVAAEGVLSGRKTRVRVYREAI